jgi:hypothetical protein
MVDFGKNTFVEIKSSNYAMMIFLNSMLERLIQKKRLFINTFNKTITGRRTRKLNQPPQLLKENINI